MTKNLLNIVIFIVAAGLFLSCKKESIETNESISYKLLEEKDALALAYGGLIPNIPTGDHVNFSVNIGGSTVVTTKSSLENIWIIEVVV